MVETPGIRILKGEIQLISGVRKKIIQFTLKQLRKKIQFISGVRKKEIKILFFMREK